MDGKPLHSCSLLSHTLWVWGIFLQESQTLTIFFLKSYPLCSTGTHKTSVHSLLPASCPLVPTVLLLIVNIYSMYISFSSLTFYNISFFFLFFFKKRLLNIICGSCFDPLLESIISMFLKQAFDLNSKNHYNDNRTKRLNFASAPRC